MLFKKQIVEHMLETQLELVRKEGISLSYK